MAAQDNPTASATLKKDDLIVIGGAGGFIAGALARYFSDLGFTRIRAIDKKPLPEWYQRTPGVECLCMDLSHEDNCKRACEDAVEVYNLAADMGGMGFIERFRIECLRSILINTHMIEAAYRAGAQRYFFSSSACAYNTDLQKDPNVRALKESDAYPAMAERGYGWEKLVSEMFCQEYWSERGFETHIARFHNVYGPCGTFDGGREKAPAALCRKVIECKDTKVDEVEIWGDGHQTRSFMYIDDCTLGRIGGVTLKHKHDLSAPQGVAGRNSDNTFIEKVLGWAPSTPLEDGLKKTYAWIEQQYNDRKAGKRTVS
ncbi:MAG: NAD-dependent epimerase/dehydratase family protein [Planctomycetota bacterium]|jgi:nucleoside-diphosphate-sugar epimerase